MDLFKLLYTVFFAYLLLFRFGFCAGSTSSTRRPFPELTTSHPQPSEVHPQSTASRTLKTIISSPSGQRQPKATTTSIVDSEQVLPVPATGVKSKGKEKGIPVASVVGGLFGGILLSMGVAFSIWMCSIRNKHAKRPDTLEKGAMWRKPELAGTALSEMQGMSKDPPELESGRIELELDPSKEKARLSLKGATLKAELEEQDRRHELPGDTGASELGPR